MSAEPCPAVALAPTAGHLLLQCLPPLHQACLHGSSADLLKALERLRAAALATASALAATPASNHPTALGDDANHADVVTRNAAALLAEAIQVADPMGFTPLMHAVQRRLGDVVAELLAAGANPARVCLPPSQNSALHVAALKGDLVSVRHLVSALTAPYSTQQAEEPHRPAAPRSLQLPAAALRGQQGQLEQRRETMPPRPQDAAAAAARAAVDPGNANGSTPLLYACGMGHVGVAAVLLKAGADPCRTNDDAVTPLMAAASGGHPHVLQLLIRTLRERQHDARDGVEAGSEAREAPVQIPGVDSTPSTSPDGTSTCARAAAAVPAAAPASLHAALAATDVNGSTALHYAARRGCNASVAMMLEAAAPLCGGAVATGADGAVADEMEDGEIGAGAPLQGLLRVRNHGGRDVLAEARLSGDAETVKLVESRLYPPPTAAAATAAAAAGKAAVPARAQPGTRAPASGGPPPPGFRPGLEPEAPPKQQRQQQQHKEAKPREQEKSSQQSQVQPHQSQQPQQQQKPPPPQQQPQPQPPRPPAPQALEPPERGDGAAADAVRKQDGHVDAGTSSWKAVVTRKTKASAAAAASEASSGPSTNACGSGTAISAASSTTSVGGCTGAPKPDVGASTIAQKQAEEPGASRADQGFGAAPNDRPMGPSYAHRGQEAGGKATGAPARPEAVARAVPAAVAVGDLAGAPAPEAMDGPAAEGSAAEGPAAVSDVEGMSMTSLTTATSLAATWEAEALRWMQGALPAGCDLELLPRHMCGLGLGELSAAQLEGLEGLHRAALAKISEARLALAVGVEVARVEEDHRRQLEIRAMYEPPGPGPTV